MNGQNKKLFVLISIFVSVLIFPAYSFAQNLPIKDSATTIVGTGITADPTEPPPACENPPCEEPPPLPPPPSGEIDAALLNDFNVRVLEGGPGFCLWSPDWREPNAQADDVTNEEKTLLYQALSRLSPYPKIINALREKVVTIEFYKNTSPDVGTRGCRDGNKIVVMNYSSYLINHFTSAAFFMTHETAHMVGARTNLGNLFPLPGLKNSPTDSDCYDDGFLKPYSLRRGSRRSESFAEAFALYIYNHKNGRYADIDDFRQECPDTYEWMRDNVFNN